MTSILLLINSEMYSSNKKNPDSNSWWVWACTICFIQNVCSCVWHYTCLRRKERQQLGKRNETKLDVLSQFTKRIVLLQILNFLLRNRKQHRFFKNKKKDDISKLKKFCFLKNLILLNSWTGEFRNTSLEVQLPTLCKKLIIFCLNHPKTTNSL